MTDTVWDPTGEAQHALASAVAEEGPATLSNPGQLNNLLRDLLPDQPREASLIVAAAQLDVRRMLSERLASGADVGTAIRLSAATLAQGRAFDPSACQWVVGEFAIALGHQVAPLDRSGWPTGPVVVPTRPPLIGSSGNTPLLARPAPPGAAPPEPAPGGVTPILSQAAAAEPPWSAPQPPDSPPPVRFAGPPTPPAPMPGTSPTPKGSRRGLLLAVLTVIAVIVIVAIAGTALLLDNHNPSPRATSPRSPTSATDVASSGSGQELGTSTTSNSTTTVPAPSSLVTLAAGVGGADVSGVRQTLGTYFSDINNRDWQGAWSTFAPSMQASISPAQIAQHSASTQDSGIVLTSLTVSSHLDLADVSFTSTQLPADSPNGATCDRWTLQYGLRMSGTVWLLESVNPVNGATYASC